jgi:hypothetical protein
MQKHPFLVIVKYSLKRIVIRYTEAECLSAIYMFVCLLVALSLATFDFYLHFLVERLKGRISRQLAKC